VQLQVLKKGTMFASRAKKLYEFFVRYDSLEAIPEVSFGEVFFSWEEFLTSDQPKKMYIVRPSFLSEDI
jgi:hypothetical protein